MDEHDFEARLSARLHRRFDRTQPSEALRERVSQAMFHESTRPSPSLASRWTRPVLRLGLVAGAVAAVLVVVVLGPRLGTPGPGTSTSPAASVPGLTATATPTPSPTNGPTSVPTTSVPSPSPAAQPSGSVPPDSTAAWTGLQVAALRSGPAHAFSVTTWAGGYLAFGPDDAAPFLLATWSSRDGVAWVKLPAKTFGEAIGATATAVGAEAVVIAEDANGAQVVWESLDGSTWTKGNGSGRVRLGISALVGTARGLFAVADDPKFEILMSTQGGSWPKISLPPTGAKHLDSIGRIGDLFVGVGYLGDGSTGNSTVVPAAWWSMDGQVWSRASVQAHPGDGLANLRVGRDGMLAISQTPGVAPGRSSYWVSGDGRSWRLSNADPLGVLGSGEGAGNPNGTFASDGSRILATGTNAFGQPMQYWVSTNGVDWTRLALHGDVAGVTGPGISAFPLRDGVLFVTDSGTWFGRAITR